ncbi:hypothetical protein BKA82DRAFT_324833 [Pisolithus tinctorius]|uniref:Uncharacterized protein n=1 Tax=Pisolithus tinctorius Marx 270 TaxID=870435 RepID=A0A0C3JI34_PISTI|nr:hypothetical protein BKA82DRAFT_324833 [Pisolithus tinctorius]KIO08738.1 hypothetical protein M404DRAFT_324833 [Pisolithus tinctorius Marx 270]
MLRRVCFAGQCLSMLAIHYRSDARLSPSEPSLNESLYVAPGNISAAQHKDSQGWMAREKDLHTCKPRVAFHDNENGFHASSHGARKPSIHSRRELGPSICSVTEYPELCATEIMKFCSIYSVPLPWRYFGPRKSGKSHVLFFFLHGGDTLQLQIKYITTGWRGAYAPCSRAGCTSRALAVSSMSDSPDSNKTFASLDVTNRIVELDRR